MQNTSITRTYPLRSANPAPSLKLKITSTFHGNVIFIENLNPSHTILNLKHALQEGGLPIRPDLQVILLWGKEYDNSRKLEFLKTGDFDHLYVARKNINLVAEEEEEGAIDVGQ